MPASSHVIDPVRVSFDDDNAVADAGLLLSGTLVKRLWLERVADERVTRGPCGHSGHLGTRHEGQRAAPRESSTSTHHDSHPATGFGRTDPITSLDPTPLSRDPATAIANGSRRVRASEQSCSQQEWTLLGSPLPGPRAGTRLNPQTAPESERGLLAEAEAAERVCLVNTERKPHAKRPVAPRRG